MRAMSRSMAPMVVRVLVVAALAVVLLLPTAQAKKRHPKCPTGFANFGDSLTDTGNMVNIFPYAGDAENSPYGETFFGGPAKRYSNGRLVPDFFSLAFRKPLLDGYFATTAFDYRHGANFAVAGATTAPTPTAVVPFPVTPYQTGCFIRLKNSAKNTTLEGRVCSSFIHRLPSGDPYPDWLYTIEAGGNDVLNAITNNVSFDEIISTRIPRALGNYSIAIQALYAEGARKFLLFNIPAQGCATIIITILRDLALLPTDSLGCVISVNQLVSAFNAGLNQTAIALRQSLPGITISIFDYYNANLEILENPTTYGLNPNLTTTACCGAPGFGTLNYNPAITCGHPSLGSNLCSNPDEYVNWDGIHFTESFYRTIATFALSGKFTDHPVDYTALCNLDFSKFGYGETYKQVYPDTCNSLFG